MSSGADYYLDATQINRWNHDFEVEGSSCAAAWVTL